MKTILLCRVSTKDQEITGYSLDAQEKMLYHFAQTKEYEIARIFRLAESASKSQVRKTFQEMLSFIEKNAIDTICCEKTDRLLRNGKDAVRIDDWLSQKETRAVHFVKENFTLTKNTPAHERFIWDVKVAAACFYTNNLSEEVRKGQKEKLSQGWFPQRPPIGYRTVGEKGHKIQVPDEKKAPLVRQAFDLYAGGEYSLSSLNEKLYEAGLRNWNNKKLTRSKLHTLLMNPYYCGKIMWHGQEFRGAHEPIVPRSVYVRVQNALRRKTIQPRYRKHLPTFKGKVFCAGCSGTITWEQQKTHWYGHCNGFRNCELKKYWRQESIEDLLSPYFEQVMPKSEKILRIIRDACDFACESENDTNAVSEKELQQNIQKANARLDSIYDDKADKKISLEFYEKKKLQYEKEIEEAEQALGKLKMVDKRYYEFGYSLYELAFRAKEVYYSPKVTVQAQRLLLSKIFSNLILNAYEIRPEYTKAFQFIAEWVPQLNRTFEPGNSEEKQGQDADLDPSCPFLRAFRDKFGTQLLELTSNPDEDIGDIQSLLSILTNPP